MSGRSQGSASGLLPTRRGGRVQIVRVANPNPHSTPRTHTRRAPKPGQAGGGDGEEEGRVGVGDSW